MGVTNYLRYLGWSSKYWQCFISIFPISFWHWERERWLHMVRVWLWFLFPPATQKLSSGLVVCKYHLQIRKKPSIRSYTNKNSTTKREKRKNAIPLRPEIQGYTGGEIYDVYFKPCNGSEPVKLGPPKETIIFQIVPGCKPRKKHGREYKLGIGDLTLPETDIAPARKPSQQEISCSNHQFSVDMLGFQGGIVGVFA